MGLELKTSRGRNKSIGNAGCMKKNTKIFICMLMLLTFTSHIVLACSYIKEPMVKFNPQEYVFYGEVVAVVGPIKSSKILRDA